MPDKSKRTLLPREDGKSYIEQVDYVNGGVGLLLRKASSGNGMTLINYLITEKPFRVFYYQVEFVFDSDKEKIITQTRLLANSLRSRAENEIPKGAGLCIYGGFIAGEHKNLKETSSIKLNYPYFSEKYYFQIGLGNIVTREPMTVHPKKSSYLVRQKLLRSFGTPQVNKWQV